MDSILPEMPETTKEGSDRSKLIDRFFTVPTVEKTASATVSLTEVFTLKKQAAELGRQQTEAELAFKEAADKMVSEFSSLYSPDFNKFANEMYTVFGDTAIPILNALSHDIRTPVMVEKVAYVVDDRKSKLHDWFTTSHDSLDKIQAIRTKIAETQDGIQNAWKKIKGHGRPVQ
jgi:hypothetical protein